MIFSLLNLKNYLNTKAEIEELRATTGYNTPDFSYEKKKEKLTALEEELEVYRERI